MKIATWNINSIKARLPHVLSYLRHHRPDVLLLQELKCTTEAFPYLEIEDAGYNVKAHGQKTYNGVAIISRFPIEDVTTTLPGDENDEAARYIEGVITYKTGAFRVASIYVPNGQSPDSERFIYKLKFFDRLIAHARTLLYYEEALIIGGDLNVAPTPLDVFDPKGLEGSVCYHPDERAKFRMLEHIGLTDAWRCLHPQAQAFSWWDYRGGGWEHHKGMRIDHLLLSPQAADYLTEAGIDSEERNRDKASDHAPVWCEVEKPLPPSLAS